MTDDHDDRRAPVRASKASLLMRLATMLPPASDFHPLQDDFGHPSILRVKRRKSGAPRANADPPAPVRSKEEQQKLRAERKARKKKRAKKPWR